MKTNLQRLSTQTRHHRNHDVHELIPSAANDKDFNTGLHRPDELPVPADEVELHLHHNLSLTHCGRHYDLIRTSRGSLMHWHASAYCNNGYSGSQQYSRHNGTDPPRRFGGYSRYHGTSQDLSRDGESERLVCETRSRVPQRRDESAP